MKVNVKRVPVSAKRPFPFGAAMSKESQEKNYGAEIRAIFANSELVAAMRKRLPNKGKPVDPALREKRWDESVEVFCRKDADWWSLRDGNGKQ